LSLISSSASVLEFGVLVPFTAMVHNLWPAEEYCFLLLFGLLGSSLLSSSGPDAYAIFLTFWAVYMLVYINGCVH